VVKFNFFKTCGATLYFQISFFSLNQRY